jgi:serine protease Do
MLAAAQANAQGAQFNPSLGLRIQEVTPQIAQAFGLASPRGGLLVHIDSNGSARGVGLEVGDLIVKFNGQDIADLNDIRERVEPLAIGMNVSLTVIRLGQEKVYPLNVGKVALLRTPECQELSPLADNMTRESVGHLFGKAMDDMI